MSLKTQSGIFFYMLDFIVFIAEILYPVFVCSYLCTVYLSVFQSISRSIDPFPFVICFLFNFYCVCSSIACHVLPYGLMNNNNNKKFV